ncbi:hypothetical protein CRUP_015038, partial [Coryphaenoides rupestris]
NHATQWTKTKFPSMFQLYHKCVWKLRCSSCPFSTSIGDLMASHMTDPAHHTPCSLCLGPGGGEHNRSRAPHKQSSRQAYFLGQRCSEERRAQLLSGGGAFVPIHLLSSGTVSTRLSVKSLSSPPPPCSSPAVTIRVLGPRPAQSQVEQASRPVGDGVRVEQASRPAGDGVRVEQASRPAGDGDLQVVLFALCSGLPQASRHYQLDPGLIHSWVLQREQDLKLRTWGWDTEPVAEWVLVQREQQGRGEENTTVPELHTSRAVDRLTSLGQRVRMGPPCSPSAHCSEERRAQLLSGGGAFVPIHLLSSGTVSTRLSVKSLSSPPPPCSSPAVTIRVLGPRPAQSQVEQASRPVGDGVRVEQASRPAGDGVRVEQASRPAGDGDLQVVLFALCSGLPQASRHYQLDPGLIHSWVLQREQDLKLRTWGWDTEPVAEWVLVQREQQMRSYQPLSWAVWMSSRCSWDLRRHGQQPDPAAVRSHREPLPHLDGRPGSSLLLMDKHRGHEGAEFCTTLGVNSTLSAIIPIGCSAHLQPLDACITPVLREFFQARWSQLMSREQGGGLGDLALTLTCWLSEAASTLERLPHILRR